MVKGDDMSMMSRRAVLQWLLGASAAALVLPSIERITRRGEPLTPPEPHGLATDDQIRDEPRWLATYDQIRDEAFRLWSEALARGGLPLTHPSDGNVRKIGHPFTPTIVATHQLSITVDRTITEGALPPAMAALAAACLRGGLDRYGRLDPPRGVAYADAQGPLRMVVAYSLVDGLMVRFDVLGGSSPAGEKLGRQYRADGLKRWIRHRLTTDYAVRPVPA